MKSGRINESFILFSHSPALHVGFQTKSTSVIIIHINKSIEVGGSTRGLTRRGDWRSLFCSITELPQTKLLKSATLDCSLLKVEAERTDPEAGGEEEVREKTE
ncbi:unnamed protein product, partial [Brassica oleracea]